MAVRRHTALSLLALISGENKSLQSHLYTRRSCHKGAQTVRQAARADGDIAGSLIWTAIRCSYGS